MTKNAFTTGLLLTAATVVLGAGACGGPEVPAEPTWERDIRPLMEARCIRCHDGPPGNEDPLVKDERVSRRSAISFNVQRFEDLNPAARIYLVNQSVPAVKGTPVPPATMLNFGRMPPPPAEALEEWQIEMLENWTKNPR